MKKNVRFFVVIVVGYVVVCGVLLPLINKSIPLRFIKSTHYTCFSYFFQFQLKLLVMIGSIVNLIHCIVSSIDILLYGIAPYPLWVCWFMLSSIPCFFVTNRCLWWAIYGLLFGQGHDHSSIVFGFHKY